MLKMLMLAAIVAGCGGTGSGDDDVMPDALGDPFPAMQCASDWGSAGSDLIVCDTACVHPPTYTLPGCGLATNPGDMLMDSCPETFAWGSASGCCTRVSDLSEPGRGSDERFLECR